MPGSHVTTKHQVSVGKPIRLLTRIPVPWLFVLTFLVGIGLESAFHFKFHADRLPAITAAGIMVFVAGAAIAAWGWAIFYKARTTTVPGKASAKLVTWGPYRITRNPMYVGLITAYLGEAGILKQVWPVIVLPLMIAYVNSIVIPIEEARLKEVFEDEYERYRSRVRRWI